DALEQEHGPLPTTPQQRTGWGRHVFFRHPGRRVTTRAGSIAAGLDVRGDGGSVVVCPSTHHRGAQYEWLEGPGTIELADAPPWLLDLVLSPRHPQRTTSTVVPLPDRAATTPGGQRHLEAAVSAVRDAPEGSRNCTLNGQAFLIGRRVAAGHVSEQAAQTDLFQAALDAGLGEAEAQGTLRSGLRAGMALPFFRTGSDVEVARRCCDDLEQRFGQVIYCQGEFWRYDGSHWRAIPKSELRRIVHEYDGAVVGEKGALKLISSRVSGVVNELEHMLNRPRFFTDAPAGINCRSGFIRFGADGTPRLETHDREHRQRHVLPGSWTEGQSSVYEDSLLQRLLEGSFHGDQDAAAKCDLLAEVAGSAALGHATKLSAPKALVLHGPSAENGKSQMLDLLRGLLPTGAVSSIAPARFGNRTFAVHLAGKQLNAPDELGGSDAIASDQFKQIVTGEPLTARDVYRAAVEFRPQAQHVFATNTLPSFRGGFDNGVRRRLMVLKFNRVIPRHERVERIGQRVTEEEPDLVLDWAVQGAARLVRRGEYSEPDSSREELREWILVADPVVAWLESDRVVTSAGDGAHVRTSEAHRDFRLWAILEGYGEQTLPRVNQFSQRVAALGARYGLSRTRRGSTGTIFVGLSLVRGPW
ncbi:MAG: phage/plasmid primase, P4 family, partial [Planctomycetota bacterium]